MVREEQGPDAVILSNRAVDGGVEIVTAVDYDVLLKELGVGEREGAARAAGQTPAASAPAAEAADPALLDLRREVKTLRGLLEHQLSDLAWGEMGRKHPRRTLLMRRLRELGLSAALAERVAAEIQETDDFDRTWRDALARLAHYLPVTDDDILTHGGVAALIGPTGVGKTTSVAKLAARFILRHGAGSVGLITTDEHRIGAHEQIKIYGKILGAPVWVARDAAGLAQALAEMHTRKLVLIDTAGMSQRDVRLVEQFELIRAAHARVRPYLVLSATSQLAALEETARAFASARLVGCVITKIDETTSLGGVLSVASQHRLPIAYVSEGQRVPEDLRPARSASLVSRCVAIQRQTEHMLASRASA
jgi:flagellar biosynthesis protein FlhF